MQRPATSGNLGWQADSKFADMRHAKMQYVSYEDGWRPMNAIVVKVLHIAVAFLLTLALLVAGAFAADAYHLPLIHAWALAHGSILIIFPLYFWACYSATRPLANRLRGTS
jgi:hypothetical protein